MKTKNCKFILCIAVGVLAVIIITFVIIHMTIKDCPLTDVKLGMTFDNAINILDKSNINYVAGENKLFKTISYDQKIETVNGKLYFLADKDNCNIQEIFWFTYTETIAGHNEELDIINNYLLELYGNPKEDNKIFLDSFQSTSWLSHNIRVTFNFTELDKYSTRIQITWENKENSNRIEGPVFKY